MHHNCTPKGMTGHGDRQVSHQIAESHQESAHKRDVDKLELNNPTHPTHTAPGFRSSLRVFKLALMCMLPHVVGKVTLSR